MIRHIVFFTVPDATHLTAVHEGLMTLADIPHARHFEVGHNLHADRLTGTEVDFVVYAEFTDEAALEAYKAHPIYQRAIDIVKPMRELRIAADVAAAEPQSLDEITPVLNPPILSSPNNR